MRHEGTLDERFITVVAPSPSAPEAIFARLEAELARAGAHPVALQVFGPLAALRAAHGATGGRVAGAEVATTWVGATGDQRGGVGLSCWALGGAAPTPVRLDGQLVGHVVAGRGVRLCRLAGLGPADTGAPPARQAAEVFERMTRALASVGMALGDVRRTWFYNHDLLAWYGAFNTARAACFTRAGVDREHPPASTGIGAPNLWGAALTVGVLAVAGDVGDAPVPSPLQDSAVRYGSLFSRARELTWGGARRILVSGTASIGRDGATTHRGDFLGQLAQTLRVVTALLDARGARLADVVRATAYVARDADLPAFRSWWAANGLATMPLVVTTATVCREDLLFELEADAIIGVGG